MKPKRKKTINMNKVLFLLLILLVVGTVFLYFNRNSENAKVSDNSDSEQVSSGDVVRRTYSWRYQSKDECYWRYHVP